MPLISTLVQQANDFTNPAIEKITEAYATYFLPQVERHKDSLVPLGTAAALGFLTYRLYNKMIRAPAHLQHMKQCDYFTAIKYYFNNGLVHDYAREVIEPLRDNSPGIFTVSL